jgi:hypothetical protein
MFVGREVAPSGGGGVLQVFPKEKEQSIPNVFSGNYRKISSTEQIENVVWLFTGSRSCQIPPLIAKPLLDPPTVIKCNVRNVSRIIFGLKIVLPCTASIANLALSNCRLPANHHNRPTDCRSSGDSSGDSSGSSGSVSAQCLTPASAKLD